MPFKTAEEREVWRKAYYEKNKEVLKDRSKAYYEKNKEACTAYKKAYYKKNKEAIKAHYEKNKEARAVYTKAYREKNKEAIAAKRKAYLILKKYGMTLAEKKKMQDEQGNKCKICCQDFLADVEPHVDHCHTTGEIRGLLCVRCNIGLGQFQDNPLALIKAAEYLKEQGEQDVR
jgi:hypothetical protein